ncbi:MAG: hypothetical protein U0587_14195 [Candidatus Binatia bacterium]
MSTMTGNLRRAMLLGAVGLLALVGGRGTAQADVASDKPGAVLIFPKIVVDTSGVLSGGVRTDTEIQLTNTSNSVIAAHCFIIDMTSRCSNDGTACTAAAAANGLPPGEGGCAVGASCLAPCTPKVVENDFPLLLTKRQPISWKASEGLTGLPCGINSQVPPSGCTGSNGTSSVARSQTDPWIGEIKCIQVDPVSGAPAPGLDPANNFAGDLKGEATTVRYVTSGAAPVDARKYNAIGLQATGNFPAPTDANNNPILSIGGETPQYNGCPKVVILDHMFDYGVVATHAGSASPALVTTDLTVVPCSEDLATQTPKSSTLQFLIYNEFEQRFSTSTPVNCFKEVQLADIDTRPGNVGNNDDFSIFNANVQGTLTGQTRIRPVATATSDRRVLAVSESFYTAGSCPGGYCSTAANTMMVPGTGIGDTLTVYPGVVPGP